MTVEEFNTIHEEKLEDVKKSNARFFKNPEDDSQGMVEFLKEVSSLLDDAINELQNRQDTIDDIVDSLIAEGMDTKDDDAIEFIEEWDEIRSMYDASNYVEDIIQNI